MACHACRRACQYVPSATSMPILDNRASSPAPENEISCSSLCTPISMVSYVINADIKDNQPCCTPYVAEGREQSSRVLFGNSQNGSALRKTNSKSGGSRPAEDMYACKYGRCEAARVVAHVDGACCRRIRHHHQHLCSLHMPASVVAVHFCFVAAALFAFIARTERITDARIVPVNA